MTKTGVRVRISDFEASNSASNSGNFNTDLTIDIKTDRQTDRQTEKREFPSSFLARSDPTKTEDGSSDSLKVESNTLYGQKIGFNTP